ncbi:MAG: 50S ribosomal protein L5, partial [Verrucomicrobiia bacterium]
MNIPELKKIYLDEVAPALLKSLGLKNVHQVPKIEKVVLNSSFGAELDKNGVIELKKDMTELSGQAPIVVLAKMSVSNFKLREGMPVGIKVTLRGNVMW